MGLQVGSFHSETTLSVRPSALRFRALTLVPFDLFSSNFA